MAICAATKRTWRMHLMNTLLLFVQITILAIILFLTLTILMPLFSQLLNLRPLTMQQLYNTIANCPQNYKCCQPLGYWYKIKAHMAASYISVTMISTLKSSKIR